MKKMVAVAAGIVSLAMLATTGLCADKKEMAGGKKGYDKHCAGCHPNGGNIMNPNKTMSKKSLASHGIKTDKDVIAKMRNPGPGMTKFSPKALPDKEAKAIADYMLATFK